MISAIAHEAIGEAAQRGAEHCTFRGYRIDTRSMGNAGEEADFIELTLREVGRIIVRERVCIAVARVPHFSSACTIVPGFAAPSCAAPEEVSRWLCQPV